MADTDADQATSGASLKFTKIKFGKFQILQHVSSILMVECLTEQFKPSLVSVSIFICFVL